MSEDGQNLFKSLFHGIVVGLAVHFQEYGLAAGYAMFLLWGRE